MREGVDSLFLIACIVSGAHLRAQLLARGRALFSPLLGEALTVVCLPHTGTFEAARRRGALLHAYIAALFLVLSLVAETRSLAATAAYIVCSTGAHVVQRRWDTEHPLLAAVAGAAEVRAGIGAASSLLAVCDGARRALLSGTGGAEENNDLWRHYFVLMAFSFADVCRPLQGGGGGAPDVIEGVRRDAQRLVQHRGSAEGEALCPICLESVPLAACARGSSCGHDVCVPCLRRMLVHLPPRCPMCRTEYAEREI